MTVPAELIELVERFERNIEAYKSGHYNETQVRREYIDPFFELLGWDVQNRQGYAEAYKDVIHEDSLRIGGTAKAPDYGFRIGGTRKFFLEAKKPSVDIKGGVGPSFQVRRYAWSAKLPLSILTDFEELAVYDCHGKPDKNDKASKSRTMYLTFDQYPAKWEEISSIFSRDAVLKGSFDKYAMGTGKKRGTAEVDKAFLSEIESWRDILARNIALRNPVLTQRELNFAVQKIIDRIIFLRICEDRGIENYLQLMSLTSGPGTYSRLLELFRHADQRYNSGLFHFSREKGRPGEPDSLTPNIAIDDKALKGIIKNLYYPDSPYEFSVLPADILGQVYEQFLGKVIRLTKGHQARVEDKPEVKKAGGVYYTPTYIVDYIVKNTVGKLLDGKTPKQAEKLRILDPACGSGSFLIGAYQYLLDWHRKYYEKKDPDKLAKGKAPSIYQGPAGEWRLTTSEKKRILLNNIYGVDIDLQAVEVTKLSLLLKVLEDENRDTLQSQLSLFKERALPDLGNNIKCGNSLIGPDFYDGQQMSFLDDEERYRINVFDWDSEFPAIMKAGGFNAVIGNPPYGAGFSDIECTYMKQQFSVASSTLDSFALFVEKGSQLLKETGLFGMIIQSGWVSSPSMSTLREVFVNSFKPLSFASMPYDVFGAYIDTVIVIAERLDPPNTLRNLEQAKVKLVVFPIRHKIRSADDFSEHEKIADAVKWFKGGNNEFLVVLSDEERSIIDKLVFSNSKFSDVADIQRGVTPFHTLTRKPLTNPHLAFTGTVRRYKLAASDKAYIQYDETLAEFKPNRYFKGSRLLLRELISRQLRLQAVYVDKDFITNKSMQSFLLLDSRYSLLYLLGLLNSNLLSWYFLSIHSVGRRDDFPKIVLKQSRELPFKSVNFSNNSEVKQHNKMVGLIKQMLKLNNDLTTHNTDHERTNLQRQIDAIDHQIDNLVYELYGLTDKEIRIVEGDG